MATAPDYGGLERKKRRRLWWQKHKNKKGQIRDQAKNENSRTQDSTMKAKKVDEVSKYPSSVSSRGFRRTGCDGVHSIVTTSTQEDPALISDVDSDTESMSDNSESVHDYKADTVLSVTKSRLKPAPPESIKTKMSKKRYILFFGNLPFESTAEEIMTHFERRGVPIMDLRLLTSKETGKSRGCAFADFDSNKTMQNALKFHRSCFKGKRINIEVTCGGGGSKESRKERIRVKNRTYRKKDAIKKGKYYKKI